MNLKDKLNSLCARRRNKVLKRAEALAQEELARERLKMLERLTIEPEKADITEITQDMVQAIKESLEFAELDWRKLSIKAKSYIGVIYYTNARDVRFLLEELAWCKGFFLGHLSQRGTVLLRMYLGQYKRDGGLREKAIDYKLGVETDENREGFQKYIVLCKLIGRWNSC